MAASSDRIMHSYAYDNGATGESSLSVDTCIFDLDDTLYPLSSGLALACTLNIREYAVERLGIDPEAVNELTTEMYKSYGTTAAGFRASGYPLDFDDWHKYVHGRLPYDVLHPDPVLRALLQNLPQRKFVFTNSDRTHAAVVLKKLGLEGCFEKVICFEDVMSHPPLAPYPSEAVDIVNNEDLHNSWHSSTGPLVCCKPQAEAFHRALALANADPSRTIFFDDSVRNIAGAKAVGLRTVLVGKSIRTAESDWAISSIHNVREAIPELWLSSESRESERVLLGTPVIVQA